MCVIVHQGVHGHLDKKLAELLWEENPDGGGFAYVNNASDIVWQKHMSFSNFWSAFEQARSENTHRDFLIHFRIATNGSVDIKNVHPFKVSDTTVMAHNGIIHDMTLGNELEKLDITDTEMFVAKVLPSLNDGWLDNPHARTMVEDYIGWSKLLFLTADPELKRTVYRLGDWDYVNEGKLFLSNLNHTKLKLKAPIMYTSENSEAWNAWWQFRKSAEETGHEEDLVGWEFELLLDGVSTERRAMGITTPVIVVNETTGHLDCSGCGKGIDTNTADCMCWDLACLNCMNMVANCQETDKCAWDAQFLLTELDERTKNAIERTYQSNVSPISKGAENINLSRVERW